VVVASRNDDHGGDLLQRMQLFIDGLLEQTRKFKIKCELIIVEWNPPPDKPSLFKALKWPNDSKTCIVRLIEVPPEVHNKFNHSGQLPLFQMIAKNVGIRRAKGEFILSTNIDVLFSNELMEYITSKKLQKNSYYRVDRYDVPSKIPGRTFDEKLEFCKKNVLQILTRDGIITWPFLINEFQELSSGITSKPYMLLIKKLYRLYQITPLWLMTKLLKNTGEFKDHYWIYSKKVSSRLKNIRTISMERLHTNACGDFTLMARNKWIELKGYAELEMYSLHLDTLLIYMAHYLGLNERILPYSIYHIEHSSGWAQGSEKKLTKNMEKRNIPVLKNKKLNKWIHQMKRERKPLIFNDDNWGLKKVTLKETQIS
jgi:hypothetical protein